MISVIIPVYNESEGLALLYERLTECAGSWDTDYEVVLVDDGSDDDTLSLAEEIAELDSRWKVIALTRNFGHQPALTAGLEHAQGDIVAILDADLQDPPEELPRFFAKVREGYDVVYGIRTQRKEGILKRTCYYLYYRLLASLASIDIPVDSGDFCVLSRKALDRLNSLPERSRFVRGLRSWIGYRQSGVEYERQARQAGTPKYTLRKLLELSLEGIVNFSSKPLRMIAGAGIAIGIFATMLASLVFVQYLADWTLWGYNPRHSRGWTSLVLAVLFLGSVQLFCLGIIGEYLGRLFEEIKRRPVYLIDRTINFAEDSADGHRLDSRHSPRRPHLGRYATERSFDS